MTEPQRLDPDKLLASIQRAEAKQRRGRLKIFFGMSPGVGKTYAMLENAQQLQAQGVDVLVGLVETHGRTETEALLAGLTIAPRKKIAYRGVTLVEMDLDWILQRRPQVAIVDELAHANAPGSRHLKRYQDVLELLDAGIDVHTTLNVQHIASRADTVREISGVPVQETVPDTVFEAADEIELVDLTVEHLRKRLAEGKVYLGERAATAAENFFREGNLSALREMALRLTAERVDKQMREWREGQPAAPIWKAGERLMVAVGPSEVSARLIRWTRRMAFALKAPWLAVTVEPTRKLTEAAERQLTKNLELARELGAEVVTTVGNDVTEALLRVAREHNVSQIVIGQPGQHPFFDFLRGGSIVQRLMRRAGDIDVYVVRAEGGQRRRLWRTPEPALWSKPGEYAFSAATIALLTLLNWFIAPHLNYYAISMFYLLAVVALALVVGPGPVMLAATLSAACWDFLFIPPPFTFYIGKVSDVLMLGIYFAVALVAGHLTSRVRAQQIAERRREERATALYKLTREVTSAANLDEMIKSTARQVDVMFQCDLAVLLPASGLHPASTAVVDEKERGVAEWALRHRQTAGRFTDTLPSSRGMYVPLRTVSDCVGVMGILPRGERVLTFEQRDLLETFASQIALVIERERLQQEARSAEMLAMAEQLHRTLLNSVSHELRIPIAAVIAATENLEKRVAQSEQGLVTEVREAALRLNMLVRNLLDMARLESGMLQPKMEWFEVGELVNAVVEQHFDVLKHHELSVSLPEDLPLAYGDFGLLQQALANLVHNAMRHTPVGTGIKIAAAVRDDELQLSVLDNGLGFGTDDLQKLFQKFQRGSGAAAGAGLGLSIVKGFVEANGGTVEAHNRQDGGAQVTIRLPLLKQPQHLHA
jgi:two-component system sensor histidine kinase KdpD